MTHDESRKENSALSSYGERSGAHMNLLEVLKGFMLCCYILCPPLPDRIVRKLAFHPPKKGSYSAVLKDSPDVHVTNASELVGQDFRIVPRPITAKCTSAKCVETGDLVEVLERPKKSLTQSDHK
ncbi:hypothetical protein GCK32_002038 [Trichostrongylus colubriformis]|uniref:Uncharacterized protein n=1 Tax=Trichostrongylus colubriformis TaxID=6319 RepID=A0AAN8IDP4_TRICO